MKKKMYVDVTEDCEDWGCSKVLWEELLWHGKRSVKKTFPWQEKGQQNIRSCDVLLAHLLYHSFLIYTIIRKKAIDYASI